jgi:hypothetical protein
MAKLAAFVDGKDVNGEPYAFPKVRFREKPGAPALPENTFYNRSRPSDIIKGELVLTAQSQGVLLGVERVDRTADHQRYVVAYIGFESKSSDTHHRNFYYGLDVGSLDDARWACWYERGDGRLADYGSGKQISVADAEMALREEIDKNIAITLGTSECSSDECMVANETINSLIPWQTKTVSAPYLEVPMDALPRGVINAPATEANVLFVLPHPQAIYASYATE